MISNPKLARIFGVRLRLHYTCFVAFVLIAIVVVTQFPEAYPLWQRIGLGITGSLLFLMAISVRELVLSFIAISKGVPVKSVTLFVFGGVSKIAGDATLPILELLLAATGLLSSLLIAGIFYGVYIILASTGSIIMAGLIQWLAFIYFMLVALFHYIPGFPLDGGRLLRTLLWKTINDYDRATRMVCWVGWGVGLLFMAAGIFLAVVARQWFVGLFLLFMGWVLQTAAAQSRRQAVMSGALRGVTARDIMSKECPIISQQLSVGQLVRDCILVTAQRYFVVADGVKLQGIVTMGNVKRIPKERWDFTPIGGIMTPASGLKIAHAGQSALSLLEQMDDLEIKQMPVLEADEVIGIVIRESLIRLGKTRAELGA
ncbi:hypothetical protein ACFLTZ_03370 [Chloroflexota bacterium]